MERYVIGIDGGGTKTEAVLVDFMGNVIGCTRGGSTNYQAVRREQVKHELKTLVQKLLKRFNISPNRVKRMFLGLAGAGRKSDREAIKRLFNDTDFKDRITVDSDAVVALAGAFGNRPGIILIAGTGAICFGKNAKGNVVRSGGWGYLLGDEGSGYYIGRRALIAALKDFDGRGEKTSLRNTCELKYKLNSIDEIIPLIYQNKLDRIAIANLAPQVFEQAKKGDSVAQQIIKQTGKELGKLAKAVAINLHFGDEKISVALIGSIFKHREMLVNEISKQLYEISWDIEITDPYYSPSIGAAVLALEQSGVFIDDNILEKLKKSSPIFIE